MATVRIKPSGSQWIVTRSGGTSSNHRKKARAVNKAKSVARSGDQVVVHRKNGTVQNQRRVR